MPNSKKVKASDNSKVENRNGRKKKSSGQNGKSKTFLCELYKANLLCHLKYHVSRVHAKIKDYQCKDCGSEFADKRTMQRHNKAVHLMIKDHICKDCGKTFSDNSNLKTHENSVHLKIKDNVCLILLVKTESTLSHWDLYAGFVTKKLPLECSSKFEGQFHK